MVSSAHPGLTPNLGIFWPATIARGVSQEYAVPVTGKGCLMKRACMIALILATGSIATFSTASTNMFFKGLGDLPGGAFFSAAYAVSGDGSIIVGRSVNSNGKVDFHT